MRIINKPEVSGAITLLYKGLLLFIVTLTVLFSYAAFFTPMGNVGIGAAIISAFAGMIILLVLVSINRTTYILTKEELIIKATRLIGGGKTIPLKTVKSIEKTTITFGIKLFGASFHGGYYYVPGMGRAFLTITNFKDGLLIKTSHENYLITPCDPLKFKESMERRKKDLFKDSLRHTNSQRQEYQKQTQYFTNILWSP
jgi:hypothetical protein